MFNGVDKALLKTSNNCTFIGSKRLSTTKKRGEKKKRKKKGSTFTREANSNGDSVLVKKGQILKAEVSQPYEC